MRPLMNECPEDFFFALALLDDEDLSISDDDLLLLEEDYADLSKTIKSSPRE